MDVSGIQTAGPNLPVNMPGQANMAAAAAQSPQPWSAQPGYPDPRMRGLQPTQGAPNKRYAVGKNPTTALVLALMSFLALFIPLGQFYNGDIKKALLFVALLIICVPLVFVIIGDIGILAIWIWSIVDAYNVASRKSPKW